MPLFHFSLPLSLISLLVPVPPPDVKRYNIHDLTSVVHRFNANPEEDLFAKEREAAELAAQNLRHGGSAKKANSKSAKEDAEDKPAAAAKQSWGAWIKGKIYGQ